MVSIVHYNLKIFDDLKKLSKFFSELLKDRVDEASGKFNLALSGGSTPKFLFKYLSSHYQNEIEWNKISFFFGDERCVPPDHDESNYKMANEILFNNLNIAEKNIFRIKGENSPKEEAVRYSNIILSSVKVVNNFPQFDMIMLGLGKDGHTASIFPDQMNLLISNKICDTAIHPVTKQNRITLTGRILNNAKLIVFVVTGISKSKIVNKILNKKEDAEKLPANFISPIHGDIIWLLGASADEFLKTPYNH